MRPCSRFVGGLLVLIASVIPWGLAAQSAGPPLTLPAVQVKGGTERTTLLRLYKVAKWDLGIARTPVYEPAPTEEIVVVRFFREAINADAQLTPHDVFLIDSARETRRRDPEYWRLSSGRWSEWVFIVPRGTKIDRVTINGTDFDASGYQVPAVPQPIEE